MINVLLKGLEEVRISMRLVSKTQFFFFVSCLPVALAVLLAMIIVLVTGALVAAVFLNYRRTGSLIPSMPKLPRYLSWYCCLLYFP